jgi:hypothetical protein
LRFHDRNERVSSVGGCRAVLVGLIGAGVWRSMNRRGIGMAVL